MDTVASFGDDKEILELLTRMDNRIVLEAVTSPMPFQLFYLILRHLYGAVKDGGRIDIFGRDVHKQLQVVRSILEYRQLQMVCECRRLWESSGE